MLSINTNLSSIITQNSMKQSTNKLNEAVERMTTGYKINHAKDNAANYGISTNMTTKIGAYDVAADNVAMGMDMLTTATESLGQIENKLTRLRALATQAQNGTYGGQSLSAIQSEANSITKEIERLYSTAEYNGVKLLDTRPEIPQGIGLTKDLTPRYAGFIENPKDYTDKEVRDMDKLSEVNPNTTISSGQYSISSDKELKQLADMVNAGKVTGGEFVLANDIDLSKYATGEGWTPIGITETKGFRGVFNGNGNSITGLKINRPDSELQGLFGFTHKSIKNLAIEGCDIVGGEQTGALVGSSRYNYTIENCYSTGTVSGDQTTGGLIGFAYSGKILNCYSTAETVSRTGGTTGGLAGGAYMTSLIENCFSTGNVKGYNGVGGLLGIFNTGTIKNCYSLSNVEGRAAGGLVGEIYSSTVENCYSSGKVVGVSSSGGLFSTVYTKIDLKNCYTTADVTNNGNYGAGVIGYCSITSESNIENVYCYGELNLKICSGGFIGRLTNKSSTLNLNNVNIYSKINFTGNEKNGSFIGVNENTGDEITFGTLNISNSKVLQGQGVDKISGCYKLVGGSFQSISYDMTNMLAGIKEVELPRQDVFLQVGTNSDENSSISFNSKLEYDILKSLKKFDITSNNAFKILDKFLSELSDKQTQLGAAQNRLESAMDEIITQHDNLVSARSTLRDADMAELSSKYIQQQILQEASATLMSTANQSPAIALQLI